MDLTHSFRPGIPHWEGFPNEIVETVFNFSTSGFLAQKFILVGQWGTHVDSPAHFHQGKRTVDQIDVKEMLLPLVVLDIHQKVSANPDYTVNMDDVKEWESKYGKIPEGCFVALRTDWSKRWPNQTAMLNRDRNGTFHYPGWSMEVLQYLYEDRNITASGHETTDTDPGFQTTEGSYTLESYILGRECQFFNITIAYNIMIPDGSRRSRYAWLNPGSDQGETGPVKPLHQTLPGGGALPGRQALSGQGSGAGRSKEQMGDAIAPPRKRRAIGLYRRRCYRRPSDAKRSAGQMIVISNSTPLIALAKINHLQLLKEYFGGILIPEEVYDEVVRRGSGLAGASEIAACDWITRTQVTNRLAVDALCISLDRGEAEAIVLASEKNGLLIIDDGEGRKAARQLGLKITGTIGILLLASKERKLDLRSALDDLKAAGFHLSNKEYDRILSLI